MAIVAADLKFLSSERMTNAMAFSPDSASGGGHAAGPVVQDGVSNNVFPDVMPSDRATGRRQHRLVYPAVLSNENSAGSNFKVALADRPTDAAVEVCLIAAAQVGRGVNAQTGVPLTESQKRSAYWAARDLERFDMRHSSLPRLADPTGATQSSTVTAVVTTTNTTDLDTFVGGSALALGTTLKVGDKIAVLPGTYVLGNEALADWRTVTAVNSGAGTLSFSGTITIAAGTAVRIAKLGAPPMQVSAPALLTAGLSAGGQDATVDRLEVRVFPTGASLTTPGFAEPTVTAGSNTGQTNNRSGKIPAFEAGKFVLIQHPSTPATREVAIVEHVNYQTGVVRLTAGVANTYPTGATVSTLLDLGDAQAIVSLPQFYQQAWTRTWADAPSGATIAARYNGVVGMNNAGGVTDRWAIVFTSATAFDLVSERLGTIASGNTSSNFIPLNPLTNQPYMTLLASGWTTGWLPGNAMRLNTQGAHFGVWAHRCVSPSGATGTVQGVLAIRADVDA